ncbi:MAG: chemotaxis protein CheA [Hyphomonadaceae bacterium]|nr:chemotaxis protein CheA [Hyphomonadaceae bacterium]
MDPMDAIKQTYFQECDELLAALEEGLLALEAGEGDSDTINAVFRAVHSVKGGAGAFGFEAMVAFAHVFETALDLMRSGKLAPDNDVLKIMLRASDVLGDHVQAAKGEGVVDNARERAMLEELEALTNADAPVPRAAAQADAPAGDEWGFTPMKFEFDAPAPSGWRLVMRPSPAMYAKGHDALLFLRELERLGEITVTLDASALPDLGALTAETPYLNWIVELPADVSEAAIRDVFDFVGEDCPIELTRDEPPAPAALDLDAFLSAPTLEPQSPVDAPAPVVADVHEDKAVSAAEKSGAKGVAAASGATIRVDLERVDRMIDLVGELVINQAMLAQRVAESGAGRSSTIAMGLDELEQLTREIQDSVMAIRAQPVKSVFQRMPRLVREIASATGKQVRLVMEGEATEVDKTVIERLSDPITHMLRNAIDHGLETPEERAEAGKPEEGAVRLAALHRSGRIVIEVSDDGKGINRPRVRDIAVKKGLIAPDANLTDDEIDNLIFLPGFSTASAVSNISGRGVGMDVVKRSIQALGGRISISSQPGKGSTFTLSLPLTLAVLDGMVITAGEQTLVAPLTAIVETLRPKPDEVRPLGPTGAVLAVRGGYVPLIDIAVALGQREKAADPTKGVVLLVDTEAGGRAALVADEIQGQRQVVIKSLEANYQRVDGVAAATILGDGRVALILDVDTVVEKRLNERHAPFAKAS